MGGNILISRKIAWCQVEVVQVMIVVLQITKNLKESAKNVLFNIVRKQH